jgi:putative ABC transport system permease protein
MGWAASGPDILDWRRYSHSLTGIAASLQDATNLTGGTSPRHLSGQKVTANYFDLLGAQASLGRTFVRGEDEPGQDHEVILSYALWQDAFGGENILGRTIALDDRPFVAIGVMPATYHDPRTWMNPESSYWIPLTRTQLETNRGAHMYAVFGRLAPDVTLAQAQEEMDIIGAREAKEFPNTNKDMGARVSLLRDVSMQTFEEGKFQSVASAIFLLQLAAAFLLLIACANIANLMFSRTFIRRTELALRAVMGAGLGRLLRQLLTESVILSLFGGGTGALLAIWCKSVLMRVAPKGYLPPTANVSLDLGVLTFTLVVTVLSGIVLGLPPALRMSRQDLGEELKGAATGSVQSSSMPHVRRALIVFELATTFLLLAGGGLMLRSLASLLAVNPGFKPGDFFTATLSPSSERYAKPEQIVRFFSQVQDRVEKMPGVQAVAFTSSPAFVDNISSDVIAEGRAAQPGDTYSQICIITADFFRAAGIPLLAGRDFALADGVGEPKVTIVSQAFARYFWPQQNPIGKHLRCCGMKNWAEVVAVAGDVKQEGLGAPSRPEIYFPLSTESYQNPMNIVVRSATPPTTLARGIERQMWAIDSLVPLSDVRTGEQLMTEWAGYLRYRTVLLTSFAGTALLIAVIGVFGAISYTTAQRTREIGIRIALGAQRRDLRRLILRQGTGLVLVGLAIGIGGALVLTRLMNSLLFGVKPQDPFTFAVASILLAIVALAACYVPARRAMRVDPMVALRYE